VATYDPDLTDRLSLALAEAGVLSQFRAVCLRYGPKTPYGAGRLKAKTLASALVAAGASAKAIPRFQVVQFGHQTIGDWTWFGVVHIQTGQVLEVMFEGADGIRSAGSTLHSLCNKAARQRPGIVESGPPYPRPYYDDEPGRLEAIAADLAALIDAIQVVIRDTPGLLD
jgi:hypothetical protein